MSELTKPVEAINQPALEPTATASAPLPMAKAEDFIPSDVVTGAAVPAAVEADSTPIPVAQVEDSASISAPAETSDPAHAIAKDDTTITKDESTPGAEASIAKDENTAAAANTIDEITPLDQGIMGYKQPGMLNQIKGFQKKFFWFGQEAVTPIALATYIKSEKAEIAKENAAWAAHTGKGLLFFSKQESEKDAPSGVINLAKISNITADGTIEFHFQYHGTKHCFQTTTTAIRDQWVVAIEACSKEAKDNADAVVSSDEYKKQFNVVDNKLVGAAAVAGTAGVAGAIKAEEKKENKKEANAEIKADQSHVSAATGKDHQEEINASKQKPSMSKRISMLLPGNKKAESKDKETAVDTPGAVEPVVATEDIKPGESVAAPATGSETIVATTSPPEPVTATTPVADDVTTATNVEPASEAVARPTTNKRASSYLTNFVSKFTAKKSPTSEHAPEVPAKDTNTTEPISATAPVIPPPSGTKDTINTPIVPEITPVEAAVRNEDVEKVSGDEGQTVPKTERRKSLFGPKTEDNEKKPPFYKRMKSVVNRKTKTDAPAHEQQHVEGLVNTTETVGDKTVTNVADAPPAPIANGAQVEGIQNAEVRAESEKI